MPDYNVSSPTTVTLTTIPGDDVFGYTAKLFRFQNVDDPGDPATIKEWTSEDLEHGASFEFDATGSQQYQIALTATAAKATTLDTTVTFSSGIGPSHHVMALDPTTLNELIWNFIPVA